MRLLQGNSSPALRVRGMVWLRRAAEGGAPEAQVALAQLALRPGGQPDEAYRWLEKAAALNSAFGQYLLGECFLNGWGCPRNHQEAVVWFQRSAAAGEAYAQKALGDCFDRGRGVVPNPESARRWYSLAAAQGHTEAREALSRLTRAE